MPFWTLIISNVVAAFALLFLGTMAVAAHRTHSYSIYRELQEQRVLVERADYDVQQRLRTIAAGGSYSSMIAWLGAGACLVNAAAIGFCFRRPQP